ncbi:MAG: GNAT family N-acetyltransferase [Vicinamibacterales bacterium]
MSARARIGIRQADASYADRIHALIVTNLDEGHLLPRSLENVVKHAGRFVVALRGRRVVGCAELAPLSPQVAEVRSLVVDASARRLGVGSKLVDEIRRQARSADFDQLCAFTHSAGWFSQLGFSIVPHGWLPEKIATDCVSCSQFRRCGQLAMVMPLDTTVDTVDHRVVPVRSL